MEQSLIALPNGTMGLKEYLERLATEIKVFTSVSIKVDGANINYTRPN